MKKQILIYVVLILSVVFAVLSIYYSMQPTQEWVTTKNRTDVYTDRDGQEVKVYKLSDVKMKSGESTLALSFAIMSSFLFLSFSNLLVNRKLLSVPVLQRGIDVDE